MCVYDCWSLFFFFFFCVCLGLFVAFCCCKWCAIWKILKLGVLISYSQSWMGFVYRFARVWREYFNCMYSLIWVNWRRFLIFDDFYWESSLEESTVPLPLWFKWYWTPFLFHFWSFWIQQFITRIYIALCEVCWCRSYYFTFILLIS